MKSEIIAWNQELIPNQTPKLKQASLVLIFGERELLAQKGVEFLIQHYPQARIMGCSTAGEIYKTQVKESSLVSAAISFEKTEFKLVKVNLDDFNSSYEAGLALQKKLLNSQLKHIFLLSKGLNINASQLLEGLKEDLPPSINISGGLAGDCTRFEQTLLVYDQKIQDNFILGLGLYGNNLSITCGSAGGFIPFGPVRLVTKSKDNILYTLDNTVALDLYSTYLGKYAQELPSSALYFPLALIKGEQKILVRSIIGIDKKEKSLIFAGDIPEGSYVQLMRASHDNLLEGASMAATGAKQKNSELAILISCIGRKLVLKERIEEKLEAVEEVLGHKNFIGFYSYEEIAPLKTQSCCELHNETMTITVLREK